jgi:hypothetical protein
MMRFLLPAALAAILMSGSSETMAQPPPVGLFASLGSGTTSCGAFVNAADYTNRTRLPDDPPGSFRDPVTVSMMSWVEGFVSGINYVGPADRMSGQGFDAESRYRWVENYCRGHPLEFLLNVALTLRQELIAKGR